MPHFLFWDIIMESGVKIKMKKFLPGIFNHSWLSGKFQSFKSDSDLTTKITKAG